MIIGSLGAASNAKIAARSQKRCRGQLAWLQPGWRSNSSSELGCLWSIRSFVNYIFEISIAARLELPQGRDGGVLYVVLISRGGV